MFRHLGGNEASVIYPRLYEGRGSSWPRGPCKYGGFLENQNHIYNVILCKSVCCLS